MILVKCKKEANFYWGDNLGIVVAKIQNDKENYIVYSDNSLLSMPYPYKVNELIFIKNTIPDDWISVTHPNHTSIQSFKEWAKDEYFYSNISGDGESNDIETSRLILASKIEKYVNDYMIRSEGSIEKAKKEIAKNKYLTTLSIYKERGYETIDLEDPTESVVVSKYPIKIDDLKYLNYLEK